MPYNSNLDLVNIIAHTKFGHILLISSKDDKIQTSVKGQNSVKNFLNMTGNNPNLDLVNINAYAKLCQILSTVS